MNQTVGSGADKLVLRISQDAYQGNAQFTVSVDGRQIGNTLTAETLHRTGQSDTITVQGDWAAGAHTASVNFLNDAYGGSAGADRNLYVDGAAYNGGTVNGAAKTLMSNGAANFGFTEAAAPSTPSTPTGGGSPASTTVGSGPDTLVLRVSQDAYQGNAQYTVSVDGRQIGGTLTAAALHGSGQSDTVTVKGDWTAGNHTVTVNFLNDAWGNSAGADRNLFLDSATYNGASVNGASKALMSNGPASFGFSEAGAAPSAPTGPASTTLGSGSDTLVLRVSQDAYQGSAQYTVKVDGVQIGGVQTAQAGHGSGQSDTVTVKGEWGAGAHSVDVQFLNDAWGGSTSADRNLYVDGATYNGASVGGAAKALMSNGTANFSFTEGGATSPGSTPPASGGQTDRPMFESFDNGLGAFSHRWGSVDTSVRGEVKLTGNAGLMEFPGGRSSGHGYGTYTVEAKIDGNSPGGAVLLWPGDDKWPGQEIDLAEVAVDGSGRHYGTVHWNNNGSDAYNYFIYDGVRGGVFHDYAVRWEPGRLTFFVDGAQKATTTSNVPRDYDAGGMNNVIGFLNNSGSSSVTVRDVDYSPL